MPSNRRIEITIETDRALVIRRRSGWVKAWCRECGKTVTMVTPDEASALAHVSSRTVYRWVETRRLHFAETLDGRLLICLNSLSD
ncbi:MAG TPA: helix-turn-helix domain-containing protein [Blastocatellia bacterium]|nr:helix-turn-helix domain-containing protein [Blastocatellia bacterium]